MIRSSGASAGYPLSGSPVLTAVPAGTVVETATPRSSDPNYETVTILWIPPAAAAAGGGGGGGGGGGLSVGAAGCMARADLLVATELTALHAFDANGDDEVTFSEGEIVFGFQVSRSRSRRRRER